VKPASFRYLVPDNVDEILALLAQHGENAKILAGGQSLLPILNFRLGSYDYLIDINRTKALSFIQLENDWIHIGPLTRQREIETSALVRQTVPLLSEITRHIAHLPIRTRGTIGGSLSHADPAAEDPMAMLALDAEFDIQGRNGSRTLKAADFFLGPLQTALAPDELLTRIRIPVMSKRVSFAFEEVSRRRGDFALVGVAVALTWTGEIIEDARIAACGMETGAVRLTDAERLLKGMAPSQERIAEVAEVAANSASTQSDLHASAEYRLHLVRQLVNDVTARAVSVRR
jgi:carbon-monoxide dehydrogenase medium subunit